MRSCNNIYSAIINLYASIKSSRCDAHACFACMGYSGFFRCCAVRAALAPSRHRTAAPSAALTGALRKR
ncbi:MAG: hypothetical protein WBZ29_15070 [Methanocella sp.]